MLALWGLLIVVSFMVLIMTKRATPFTALVVSPIAIGLVAGFPDKIAGFSLDGIKGVAPTVAMLLFAILYFGLMITAGLFEPLVNLILRVVKGDPLKVLVGTALLASVVSIDGDGSTTTMIVCSALIPVYKRLNMKMMDLAVLVILANSIMNLLPWGGPTARIIAALDLDSGELLRRILPGMIIAVAWVVVVSVIRGLAERKRLGIVTISDEELHTMVLGGSRGGHATAAVAGAGVGSGSASEASAGGVGVLEAVHHDAAGAVPGADPTLKRPGLLWFNLALTVLTMTFLVFGGMGAIPKVHASIIFEVAFAIALIANYPRLKDQRKIIEEHGANAMHVITMVLAAGIFMGILNGSGMSEAMGQWLANVVPTSLGSHWALVTAIASAPGTFLLSNDAFYLGVLPILAQTGAGYGFSAMEIGVASTAGQAFHLLSPLVGFIYLLLHLTGVDMGTWQRKSAFWATGTFVIFVVAMAVFGGVRL